MIGFEALAVSAALPEVAEDLGGERLYGVVFGAFMLGQLTTIPAAGALADRNMARLVYTLGLASFRSPCSCFHRSGGSSKRRITRRRYPASLGRVAAATKLAPSLRIAVLTEVNGRIAGTNGVGGLRGVYVDAFVMVVVTFVALEHADVRAEFW